MERRPIDIAAEALPASRDLVLIPTANPLLPLILDITVFAEDHIQLGIADSYGTTIWSCDLVPRGGGRLLQEKGRG